MPENAGERSITRENVENVENDLIISHGLDFIEMTAIDVKEATLEFLAKYYKENGVAPSIRKICDGVPGISNRKFYENFQGGIIEACKLANIPEPKERMKYTSKAIEEKKKKQIKAKDLDAVDEAIMQRLDRLAMELGVTGRLKALDEAIEVAAQVLPEVDRLTRLSGLKDRSEALEKQVDLASKFNVYTFNFDVKTPVEVIKKLEKINQDWQERHAELKRIADEIPSLRKKVEAYKNMNQYDLAELLGINETVIKVYTMEKNLQHWPDDSLGEFINVIVRRAYYGEP